MHTHIHILFWYGHSTVRSPVAHAICASIISRGWRTANHASVILMCTIARCMCVCVRYYCEHVFADFRMSTGVHSCIYLKHLWRCSNQARRITHARAHAQTGRLPRRAINPFRQCHSVCAFVTLLYVYVRILCARNRECIRRAQLYGVAYVGTLTQLVQMRRVIENNTRRDSLAQLAAPLRWCLHSLYVFWLFCF